MKTPRNFILAAAALAFAFVAVPAEAASVQLCIPLGNSAGSKRIVNPNTGTAYVTNGRGCALIATADIGYFLSQGFAQVGQFQAVVGSGSAAFSVVIPPGTYIRDIILQETSGASVTGGVKVGTASGGSEVSTGINLASLGLTVANDVSYSKRAFSATASQTLFFGAVSSFNSSSVTATVVYGYF